MGDSSGLDAQACTEVLTAGSLTSIPLASAFEFSVPLAKFAGKSVRVFLSSTGKFVFPDLSSGIYGTTNTRSELSPTDLSEIHRVYWDGLRVELTRKGSMFQEVRYLPNSGFEFFSTQGVEGTGSTVSTGAVDCVIPGWTSASGTNLPNRMVVVEASAIP